VDRDLDLLFFHTPVGLGVIAVSLAVAVSYLVGFVAGWQALAERFRAESEPLGETRSVGPFFYEVYMRYWTRYSSAIRMTASDEGLFLSVFFLIRLGHPPLRIPWDEIEFSRVKRFWRRFLVLTLGRQERIPMRISERMARNLGIMGRIPTERCPSTDPNFDTLSDSLVESLKKKRD
jgi:hypothetical protein